MTDHTPQPPTDESPPPPTSAGALLRTARQAQGMHIAALAAFIKVPQRKLEALEADRYHELPDTAFTRALAKTVCRSLKIDDAPVLALLPPAADHSLEDVLHGLNTPFRERPGHSAPTDWSTLTRPTIWGPAILVLAALVVYLLPHQRTGQQPVNSEVASTPASAVAVEASAAASAPASSSKTTPPSSATPASAPAASTGSPVPTGLVQLRATAESWVEVHDANGTPLLLRLLQPGEAVDVNGNVPLRVTVGNAAATQLSFRGQVIDLAPHARANIARLDLK